MQFNSQLFGGSVALAAFPSSSRNQAGGRIGLPRAVGEGMDRVAAHHGLAALGMGDLHFETQLCPPRRFPRWKLSPANRRSAHPPGIPDAPRPAAGMRPAPPFPHKTSPLGGASVHSARTQTTPAPASCRTFPSGPSRYSEPATATPRITWSCGQHGRRRPPLNKIKHAGPAPLPTRLSEKGTSNGNGQDGAGLILFRRSQVM